MNVKITSGVAIMLIIIAVGIIAFSGHRTASTALINTINSNNNGTTAGNQTTNSSQTLFSSTPYYPYSYLISPGPISQQAQSALVGFNLTSTVLQNNTAKITLTLEGSSQSQSIMLKPGYKLYIIETTFSDDGFHFDSSLGDDGFVIVNQNGYIA